MITDFDHVAHHNNDREYHLFALKHIDEIVGPGLVCNSAEYARFRNGADRGVRPWRQHHNRVYSQGYNLVKLLGSYGRRWPSRHHETALMVDYSLKGV